MTKRFARAIAVVAAAGLVIVVLHPERETVLAYSAGQQLITTAWSVGLAVFLVAVVFGWAGGKALVASSYHEAKERAPKRKRSRSR